MCMNEKTGIIEMGTFFLIFYAVYFLCLLLTSVSDKTKSTYLTFLKELCKLDRLETEMNENCLNSEAIRG